MEKKRHIAALTRDIYIKIQDARMKCNMSVGELIVRSQFGNNKYYNRMRRPEELTLKECWALEDTLKLERGAIAGMK